MTLNDLMDQLAPHFPTSVQKDLKTATHTLAHALGHPDAKSCPLNACLKPLPDLYELIEAHLTARGKSPHTIRNTKNNVSRLFRLAEAQGVFALLPVKLSPRFNAMVVPHRPGGSYLQDGSHLCRRDWPAEVEAEFAAFAAWATDPFVPGREAKWQKRPITITGRYQTYFETYFGYLHHVLKINPVHFTHLFDITLIERFILWHINEKWHRTTTAALEVISCIHALATQYRPDPALAAALSALRKRLPPRRAVLNKNDAWVPLQELERVGLALWPTRAPHGNYTSTRHVGLRFAGDACLSLMLRLWVHIPYRQRNMREMKLDQNLYRTPEGRWRIRFAGEELKIGMRRGQPNVLDLPFPPALVSTLETYLSTWRPILARLHNRQEVFLNHCGRPFDRQDLWHKVLRHVHRFTGRRFHPHIIRTIWATEWISSGGDFMTAAIMLNDRLETVIKTYSHPRDANVAENAYEWVQNRVNHH